MNEREQAAVRAGMRDMSLLRLHPESAPIDVVIRDLRGRFGHHPSAFHQDMRNMTPAEYAAMKTEMLATAARRQPGALQPVDARALSRSEYASAKQALIRSI